MTRVPLLCGATIYQRGAYMFRQEEIFVGGWRDKTLEALAKRRYDQEAAQLPPLGADSLEMLTPSALERRLEQCWQDVRKKPFHAQQMANIWDSVLGSIDQQADCLSQGEHELVERALILGGSAPIEDAAELAAARALSLRLWANIGLVSGKPYMELERPIIRSAAKAMAREEHDAVRMRFDAFYAHLNAMLYRCGAMDDRLPQQMILRDVLHCAPDDELMLQLARRYLWASCDCVDYPGGVLLVHNALADPARFTANAKKRYDTGCDADDAQTYIGALDILPEEIPVQMDLERTIDGALRSGSRAGDVARTLRFLCKQGAPLSALEEVLQESLIVLLSSSMRSALKNMYYMIPKWVESSESSLWQ